MSSHAGTSSEDDVSQTETNVYKALETLSSEILGYPSVSLACDALLNVKQKDPSTSPASFVKHLRGLQRAALPTKQSEQYISLDDFNNGVFQDLVRACDLQLHERVYEISTDVLIEYARYAMHGVPSWLFQWNKIEAKFSFRSDVCVPSTSRSSLQSSMQSIMRLADTIASINRLIDRLDDLSASSMIVMNIVGATQDFLFAYEQVLYNAEHLAWKRMTDMHSFVDVWLPAVRFVCLTLETCERCFDGRQHLNQSQAIATLQSSCVHCLQSNLNTTPSNTHDLLHNFVTHIIVSYINIIGLLLNDQSSQIAPCDVFMFISDAPYTEGKDYQWWKSSYVVQYDCLPCFVTHEIADQITSCLRNRKLLTICDSKIDLPRVPMIDKRSLIRSNSTMLNHEATKLIDSLIRPCAVEYRRQIQRLFEGIGLPAAIEIIEKLLLLNSEAVAPFHLWFEKLTAWDTEPAELLTPDAVNQLLVDMHDVARIELDSNDVCSFNLGISEVPECVDVVAMLECVHPLVRVNWPLTLIIDHAQLRTHARLFELLRRLHFAEWCLKDCGERLRIERKSLSQVAPIRQLLHTLHHEMQYVMRCIRAHLVSVVNNLCAKRLRNQLCDTSSAEYIMHMHNVMRQFSLEIQELCLTSKSLQPILTKILNSVLHYRQLLIDELPYGDLSPLRLTQLDVRAEVQTLIQVLMSLARNATSDGHVFQALATALNFNGFYVI